MSTSPPGRPAPTLVAGLVFFAACSVAGVLAFAKASAAGHTVVQVVAVVGVVLGLGMTVLSGVALAKVLRSRR